MSKINNRGGHYSVLKTNKHDRHDLKRKQLEVILAVIP